MILNFSRAGLRVAFADVLSLGLRRRLGWLLANQILVELIL